MTSQMTIVTLAVLLLTIKYAYTQEGQINVYGNHVEIVMFTYHSAMLAFSMMKLLVFTLMELRMEQ